jgi:membrane-bound acyltransferase YfiQ involved in biofilm formation
MFIICIIMNIVNIVMFNCGLNIHTCKWIVSLTIILKCLLNYGIKICQNVAYHLTIQKTYNVDRTMFGATSFENAIKPKPFDGSNFKRWHELATCGSLP